MSTRKAPATKAAKPPLVGAGIPKKLEDIGPYVQERWAQGYHAALEAQMAMIDAGVALNKAKKILKSNKAYGEWFYNQDFAFSLRWGNTLQRAGALGKQM